MISDVYPGSPADDAGLMADDFLTEWNGPLETGLSCRRTALLDYLNIGDEIRVKVDREGATIVKTIRAVPMQVPPVRSRLVDGGIGGGGGISSISGGGDISSISGGGGISSIGSIGYLHLSTFSEGVQKQLKAALDALLDADVDRLVLDLRGNTGGSLAASAGVAGLFLPDESEVVLITHKSTQTRYTTQGWETAPHPAMPPLAVTVDGWSASASELVAGALVDHGRATTVGGITYGKGTAQIYNLLEDGTGKVRGVLALTTGRWVTPLGRSPIGGLAPDVRLNLPPCMHPDEVSRQASAVIRPYVDGIEITSSPQGGHSYKSGETVTLAVSLTTPVVVATTGDDDAPTMGLTIADRIRRASYRPDAPGSNPTTLIFEYAITTEDARAAGAASDTGTCAQQAPPPLPQKA